MSAELPEIPSVGVIAVMPRDSAAFVLAEKKTFVENPYSLS